MFLKFSNIPARNRILLLSNRPWYWTGFCNPKSSQIVSSICSQHLWVSVLADCCRIISLWVMTFHLIFPSHPCTHMDKQLSAAWDRITNFCFASQNWNAFSNLLDKSSSKFSSEVLLQSTHLNDSKPYFAAMCSRLDLQSLHYNLSRSSARLSVRLEKSYNQLQNIWD